MGPLLRIKLATSLSFSCIVLFLPFFAAQAAKQTKAEQLQGLLQRQMNWDENPTNAKNPNGLQLQFFKIAESGSPGKSLSTYRIYVPGIPVSKKFALTVWRIGSEPHSVSGDVYVNSKGLLMKHKPAQGQEDSDFVGDDELHEVVQAAQGEPIRYALASSDKQLLISGALVPFPLGSTGQGCRLEVRLATPNAEAVVISAEGLPANADAPFQLTSSGVSETAIFHADAKGHAVTTDIPSVDGQDRGMLKVTLATKACSTEVDVPWGKRSYVLR